MCIRDSQKGVEDRHAFIEPIDSDGGQQTGNQEIGQY